jgi:hypothetical protein
MLRVVLIRAPFVLMVPWATKKVLDTMLAALRTRRPGVIMSELLRLSRALVWSSRHRRAISWSVFAVWKHLASRHVTTDDYRVAALREYPSRWRLLVGYLRPGT